MSYRVKYYSPGDWGRSSIMNKVDEIYKSFDTLKTDYSINEILEFYNTDKYLEDGSRFTYWNMEDIKIWSKKLKGIYNRFINSISDENFIEAYKELEHEYIDDFWSLFCSTKVFKKISSSIFQSFVMEVQPHLYLLLEHKDLVNHFDIVIRAYFLSDNENAELLLDKYEVKKELHRKEIFIPPSLSLQEKEELIANYIDSSDPNSNYLNLIVNIKPTADLSISNKFKLKAKKRIEKETAKYFEDNEGNSFEYSISFVDELNKEREFKSLEYKTELFYSSKWLSENSDYATILNNFIYLFEYVDYNFRTTLVSSSSEIGAFEGVIGLKSRMDYIMSWAFDYKERIAHLQIHAYYKQLKKLNIRLEDVFEWFFNTYCLEEFGIIDYHIKMPSENSSYFEKCRTILPEMERALKLFNHLVEDDEINLELFELSSEQISFELCKSFINNKYYYSNISEELRILNYYLFSDQCMLHYLERLEKQYDSFYNLIVNEDTTIDDYPDYKRKDLNWLIDRDYVQLNSRGFLEFSNPSKMFVIKDLYENEVIHYWRYPEYLRKEVDTLYEQGVLKYEKTLFSKSEQDYLSYHMDNRNFSNTLGLRNKYLHGSQPRGDSEDIHYNNYMIFLKLFSIYIIKINDELCLREEVEKNEN